MDVQSIVEYIIAILPSVIAVLSTAGLIAKTLNQFRKLKEDVSKMTAMEQLRDDLHRVLVENCALKKQLNDTLSQIDKVHRE